MAVNSLSYEHADDDDYIDMEVGSYSSFLCHSISSPPRPGEFEFQMFSGSLEKETTTSPADELFYKGKLLPLHLPPRLQMVEKLLENSSPGYDYGKKDCFEEFYGTPLMTTTVTTPTTTSTPFESCNISPSESCRVSRELNPGEYFFEYSNEESGFVGENQKKSWTRKLKLIKQSSFGSKLKASRTYLKSFFGKSGCSDESSAAKVADEGMASKAKESLNRYTKAGKRTPFGQIQKESYQMSNSTMQNIRKNKINEDCSSRLHRRSFSMALRRHSPKKSSTSSLSSSSTSNNSSAFHGLPFLKRSSSINTEIENPIQGAIAHCKQSQQLFRPRKSLSEIGFYSLSASRIASCNDQERANLCRG